jgi:hypothetical protein
MESAPIELEKKNVTPPIKKTFGPDGNQVEFSSESAADHLDVVFCIDVTGSMSSYIERSKKVIANMITNFSESEDKPLFGVVAYRDHPPQDNTFITKVHQLSDAEKALAFVKELRAEGGGDSPEAVLQGLMDSIEKIQWRNLNIPDKTYKKLIVHVADAPPHGKEFHAENLDDTWPNGCPSGITMAQLASSMNENKIYYHFCRLNTSTDVMQEKFVKEFKYCEIIDLVITQQNMMSKKAEFDDYKVEFKKNKAEYKDKEFEEMDYGEQQECYYEAAVSKKMAYNKKK